MESAQLADVLTRLERMESAEKARNFLHTYAETMDAPDAEAAGDLFAPDGVLDVPSGPIKGRAAIVAFYAGVHERDRATKRHFLVSPKTTIVEPGIVRVQSYFLWTGQAPDLSMLGWGTYDDLIDVRGDTPVFLAKTITPHVGTDLATGWPLPLTEES